jgi:hypothetical protein
LYSKYVNERVLVLWVGGSGFAVVRSLWAEGDTTDILWETWTEAPVAFLSA